LLLPADKADAFVSNLESHGQPLVSWQTYQLKSGESIDRVATRHRISVAELKRVNGITGKRRLGAGSTLLVPGGASATPHLPDLPSSPVTVAKAPSKKPAQKATRKGGSVKVAQTRKGNAAKATQTRKTAKKGAATTAKKPTPGGPKKIVLAQKPR
jgi:membrane-bound lytic murein transglycosylase D